MNMEVPITSFILQFHCRSRSLSFVLLALVSIVFLSYAVQMNGARMHITTMKMKQYMKPTSPSDFDPFLCS